MSKSEKKILNSEADQRLKEKISAIEVNMKSTKTKPTYSDTRASDREMKKFEKDNKERIYDLIQEMGGAERVVKDFLHSISSCYRSCENDDSEPPLPWAYDREKTISRLEFASLSEEEQLELVEKGIRGRISEVAGDDLSEEVVEKFVEALMDHEKKWRVPHRELADRGPLWPLGRLKNENLLENMNRDSG